MASISDPLAWRNCHFSGFLTFQAFSDSLPGHRETLIGDRENFLRPGETLVGEGETFLDDRETLVGEGETFLDDRETLIEEGETFLGDRETLIGERETFLDEGETLIGEGEGLLPWPETRFSGGAGQAGFQSTFYINCQADDKRCIKYRNCSYTHFNLDRFVEKVLASMKGNLNFTTPDPALADIQTALDTFTAAVAAKDQGGSQARQARDDARVALLALVRQLALYVQKESKGNPTVMLSSGFDITSGSHTQTPLTTPVINNVTNGPSGTALIHAQPQDNVKSVLPQYRETGTTAWLNGPICTQMRNIPVPGLTPGKTYDFRVQFYGGSTGQSDWSDVVSHMVT